jgi:hypothetical protein
MFLQTFPSFDMNCTNAYNQTALDLTRDPKVFEYLLSHKRCRVSVDLLTRALIEGDTAIASIILSHSRL